MPANHIRGKLWINHTTKGGFSESFNFPTVSYAVATARMKKILDYRALLLPENTRIEYHSMSLVDSIRESEVVPSFIRDPQELDTETGDGVEVVNVMDDGIQVRFYTDNGDSKTFLYRALRDGWIEDEKLTVVAGSLIAEADWVTPAAGFTATSAIDHFLSVVWKYTCHVKKTGPGAYTLTPWSAYHINGIGSRDVGKGFSPTAARRRAVR